jgi:ribonuclease BN (tRNA processing enzyme)
MSTTIHILGTGTPTPTADRHGSAFALDIDGEVVMIDCGPGATGKLVRAGLWPTKIDTLFLTHHHFDHNVDLPCFLLVRWDQAAGQANDLRIIGPAPTSAFVQRLIGPDGAFAWDLTARINATPSQHVYTNRGGVLPREWPRVHTTEIEAGYVHDGGNWSMRTFHAEHVQPYLTSLAYRFETPSGVVVFTGDTQPCDTIRDAARDADVLLCMAWDNDDAMRACGEDVGQTGVQGAAQIAADAGVKKLILVHTGPAICGPDTKPKALASAEDIFSGEVVFAEELMTVAL